MEREDLLRGVYLRERLQILDPADPVKTVTGIVVSSPKKSFDGDITFDLATDQAQYLTAGNVLLGGLHLEIVPIHQPQIIIPHVGDRIAATGVWVFDVLHRWNELHPVFNIQVL